MNTRRDFLKVGAFASFYVATPGAFSAFGATGLNGVPTMAVIGAGKQGRSLLNGFLNVGNVVVTRVCDCDRVRCDDSVARARKFYEDHADRGVPGDAVRAEYDFRKVLDDPTIDMLCVATPDHWHAYMVVEAMKRGKDVYCEKPLTYSVDEARVIEEVARRTGRILQTGSMQRSWDEFRKACELVRNGVIGDVKYVENSFGGPSQPRRPFEDGRNAEKEGAPNADVDFGMWCGPAPLVQYSDRLAPRGVHDFFPMFWRCDDYFGSGMCGDWGAHQLDITQWAMGRDGTGPVKVIGSEEGPDGDPRKGGRRQHGAKLVYADGLTVRHAGNTRWGSAFYGDRGILCVDRGRFALWLGDGRPEVDRKVREAVSNGTFDGMKKVAFWNGEFTYRDAAGAEHKVGGTEEYGKNCSDAIRIAERHLGVKADEMPVRLYRSEGHERNFVNCVASRKPTIANEKVGPWSSVLCQLLNMSYIHNAGFDWDPARMAFAGGTGDADWLSRRDVRPDTGKFAVKA